MGGIAVVQDFFRSAEEGDEALVDQGGGNTVSADHLADSGVDAPPLPGDRCRVEFDGSGRLQITGYHDPTNDGVASPGERRTYARAPSGEVVAEIWAKGNGDVVITSLKSGGRIVLNGVVIDENGNLEAPGEVTAMAGAPAQVGVSTHTHLTAVSPTQPPTPGT